MNYMVADLMFKATTAWYENGQICLMLSDQ